MQNLKHRLYHTQLSYWAKQEFLTEVKTLFFVVMRHLQL